MELLVTLTLRITLVLGGAALLTAAMRRASAGARSLVWNLALLTVLALPAVAIVTPTWELAVLPGEPEPQATTTSRVATEPERRSETRSAAREEPEARPAPRSAAREADPEPNLAGAARSATDARPQPVAAARADAGAQPERAVADGSIGASVSSLFSAFTFEPRAEWLLVIWAPGALVLLAQLVSGLAQVAWIAHNARRLESGPLADRLRAAIATVGTRARVRLLETDRIGVPVTWHYLRAAILVPRGMQRWSPECQSAVLIHELEHVRRRDCWMQALGQLIVAVQWFNPLAWFAIHRLAAEREHACDDAVLRNGVRPSAYARNLLHVACGARPGPAGATAVALARSTRLRGRVQTILDPSIGRQSPNRRTTVSVAAVAVLLVWPVAALQPVAQVAPALESEIGAPPTAPGMPTPSTAAGGSAPTPFASPSGSAMPTAPAPQAPSPSLDQLVKMRIHGISPDFIAEMNDLFGPDLDIDELVKLRIHGVSGDFARSMRDKFGDLDMDDLVKARIHGVSPEFAAQMSQTIGATLEFDDLTKMRIHGVSADFARDMGDLFGHSDVDDLVQMRIHGVNGDYARAMRSALGDDLDLGDLVAGRIHGVSPAFAASMRDLLGDELSFETLKRMRIHGISTSWVEELHEDGYDTLTAQELIDVKIHGMERILRKRRGGRQ